MFIWAMFGVLGFPIRLIVFNRIDKMESKIGSEMSFGHCRGRNTWTMCEFPGSNGNGLGDIWWTDKFLYFSIID